MERLTAEQVAQRLDRHPELVRQWLREGRLRGEKFGHVWVITDRELARFLRSEPTKRPELRKKSRRR
jgi:excisionase family DNA binding protein